MPHFISYQDSDEAKSEVAERFVYWLEGEVIREARGDAYNSSNVDPTGRFWLGKLGPKDFVTLQDDRGDRLEPCAIGLRLRPQNPGPWSLSVGIQLSIWRRQRSQGGPLRWQWQKDGPVEVEVPIHVEDRNGEIIVGQRETDGAFAQINATQLTAEVRIRIFGASSSSHVLEVSFVNTSQEIADLADGRFFECSLAITNFNSQPFILEALPDSFRFDRKVEAFGINCGATVDGSELRTCDGPAKSRFRPSYWCVSDPEPDLRFVELSENPIPASTVLIDSFDRWASAAWSPEVLDERAADEGWSDAMRNEAASERDEFAKELSRIKRGHELLVQDERLRSAFCAMNRAMMIGAGGRYDAWRPFQFAFLLANMECLLDKSTESEIVDIVWFATGGGKTETYLGLLLTAAFLDRMRGKWSGITAWSRFPLRMLSLQQTQRFANAIAAAELVRRDLEVGGDPFSLGFLVGGGATPNRIRKESERENEDVTKIEDMENPFRLLELCPFCRNVPITTRFDRASWRLVHLCGAKDCPSGGEPLPIHIVDDEIWRFLPTIVIGTLDKAANIARQSGMRGLVGPPWGMCSRPGHGYTYARRSAFPNGCLVPDCRGGEPGPLPMDPQLYGPSFRLQDELHLLRDSLGAVDSHYELALDSLQAELTGARPKILASSATLAGYRKQVEVLYRRSARVFPQPAPKDGQGFWTSDSRRLMRRYVALAPRRLTVEFVIDRLIITLQRAIRTLLHEPETICSELDVDPQFGTFLADVYGTNVVYGNTLQDIDAVLRSSESQYAELDPPPNVASLTGRTAFDEVRSILARLERPEREFGDRLHLITASSMMSHGVDIDRLNVMIMLAFPLGVAEFIQSTSRVGRKWPALVIVVPKMARERDASVYRSFPQFVSHGDRFVEAIPISRKSRRVLERTISGLELSRMYQIHEPNAEHRLTTIRDLNAYIRTYPDVLRDDLKAIEDALGIDDEDEFITDQMENWFDGFERNLRQPTADARFLSDLSPTGEPMTSLRDVEEQAPVKGDSTR